MAHAQEIKTGEAEAKPGVPDLMRGGVTKGTFFGLGSQPFFESLEPAEG
jgi:hypothetical protein